MPKRVVIRACDAFLSIELHRSGHRWVARAAMTNRGIDVDVFKDGYRVHQVSGLWPTFGEGNRDVAAVSEVLTAVMSSR